MKSILFSLGITVVAIAAAIASATATWIFWDASKASDIETFRVIIGAFAGAFFAYLFVRFVDAMNKIYDRKEKNHTSIVRLQHYFNDCLNTTSDNLFIANNCIDVFSETNLNSGYPVYMNVFHEYPINTELVINLTNIDFLNEVYSLNVSLKKLNSSLASVDRAYGQVRDGFVSKTIDVQSYLENARRTRERCKELIAFLTQQQFDLVKLFATTNLLLKNPPFLTRVMLILVRNNYPKDFNPTLDVEIKRVQAEIEGIAKADEERIRKVQDIKKN